MDVNKLKCQLDNITACDIVVSRIFDCVSYWNREGDSIFQREVLGRVDSEDAEQYAIKNATRHWLMDMIYKDCEFVMSYAHELADCSEGTYEFGRSGSHIWLHKDGERIAMITCLNNKLEN